MEKLTEEQEEKLCLASLPLRNYLMKYVLPTLTQGLIEVANLRPDDPVDYLVSRKKKQSTLPLKSAFDVAEISYETFLPPSFFS